MEKEVERSENRLNINKDEDDAIVGMKVLIVEDNELNLDIVQEVLKERGLIVTGAANGQIAVDLFGGNPPGTFDAILMDMHMPVLDGVTATKQIRAMERSDAKTIPILALTANDFEEDVKRTREAGMNDHLTKPFDMEKIFSVLAEYVIHKE
ncbi:MAG: response regulator [Lachnospiraceae bacterium]|nr:response regulator [Lachnospiraceae bacterium]MDE7202077.1 response regulator [Lachnospiraceae bacterium]